MFVCVCFILGSFKERGIQQRAAWEFLMGNGRHPKWNFSWNGNWSFLRGCAGNRDQGTPPSPRESFKICRQAARNAAGWSGGRGLAGIGSESWGQHGKERTLGRRRRAV